MPAAAPTTGGATCPEAWTESAWVALASAADESVLAVKTLSPEGHLSPKDTCSWSFSQAVPNKKVCLCQIHKASFPLSPYWQPKLQGEFVTPSLQWQNSFWFKATSFSKNFSPYTHSRIPIEIFSLQSYYFKVPQPLLKLLLTAKEGKLPSPDHRIPSSSRKGVQEPASGSEECSLWAEPLSAPRPQWSEDCGESWYCEKWHAWDPGAVLWITGAMKTTEEFDASNLITEGPVCQASLG